MITAKAMYTLHSVTFYHREVFMEIIINACIISALGISFVFLFLIIQVWVTNIMAKVAGKYSYLLPEPEKNRKRPVVKAALAAPKTDDSELIAVISAAIQAHTAK